MDGMDEVDEVDGWDEWDGRGRLDGRCGRNFLVLRVLYQVKGRSVI